MSFLYQTNVAKGFPPDDTHNNFCTDPAGIICPSMYPDISGGDGASEKRTWYRVFYQPKDTEKDTK